MSPVSFTLTYDGPALRNSEMNVRDLAPAMLAIGEAFEAMNALYNDDGAKIAVNVRALDAGSFNIAFDVLQVYHNAREFFAGPDVTAAANMLSLLFGGSIGGGLIWLVRKLKGRAPDAIEEIAPDLFRITIGDETYEIPVALLKAYQELRIRRALEGIVAKPLHQPGITDMRVEANGHELARVDSDEADLFIAPEVDDDILVDETRRAAYTIRGLSFDEEGYWRLFDGSTPIRAKIDDKAFLDAVERDELRFAKHDVLVCNVRIVQRRAAKGLKNEYTVLNVIEYIPAPRQLRFKSTMEPRR